jgi:hypothetical protein
MGTVIPFIAAVILPYPNRIKVFGSQNVMFCFLLGSFEPKKFFNFSKQFQPH